MKEFIELYEQYEFKLFTRLEIYHSSIMDWCIKLTKGDTTVINIQDCDVKKAFARAYVELAEWLSENEGGY